MSFFQRPRGDITTVLDLSDRDSQDNVYFPIDTEASWFHRAESKVVFPTSLSIQESTQRGPAEWGSKCTFELQSLNIGDLLQSAILQIQLGSWYNATILKQVYAGELTADPVGHATDYWTFANSIGTAMIEYAEFVVGDQTLERISGEWIRAFYNLYADVNSLIGVSVDAVGAVPTPSLFLSPYGASTALSASRPYPTEDGVLFCILPFFFFRNRLKELFPLLSCNEGQVRIDVKLRPFEEVVRRIVGWRTGCDQTPLGSDVAFSLVSQPLVSVPTTTLAQPPAFRDFRLVTCAALVTGTVRDLYLRRPFEQMYKFVQSFYFDEPLKYVVNKSGSGQVAEVQLPLELNHPVTELIWMFRRKAAVVNNEWANFGPAMEYELAAMPALNGQSGAAAGSTYPPWLEHATLRVNGSEVVSADGDWFRQHIAEVHKGGFVSYAAGMYGYSFALKPEDHAPSGTGNMSRASSVQLRLRVRTPVAVPLPAGAEFDEVTRGGWEVFVFAVHYNWLRFQNGMCGRMFTD